MDGILQILRLSTLALALLGSVYGKAFEQTRQLPSSFDVVIDFDCASADEFKKASVQDQIVPLLATAKKDWAFVWGDRSYTFDLNRDRYAESIVPVGCSANGVCSWAIISGKSRQYIGSVYGQTLYLTLGNGRWPMIVTLGGGTNKVVAMFRYTRGAYRHIGTDYETSPVLGNIPAFVLNTRYGC